MPSPTDTANAAMLLKELTDTEIEFLTKVAEDLCSVSGAELISHANLIKNLLGAQTAMIYMMMTNVLNVQDQVNLIIQELT